MDGLNKPSPRLITSCCKQSSSVLLSVSLIFSGLPVSLHLSQSTFLYHLILSLSLQPYYLSPSALCHVHGSVSLSGQQLCQRVRLSAASDRCYIADRLMIPAITLEKGNTCLDLFHVFFLSKNNIVPEVVIVPENTPERLKMSSLITILQQMHFRCYLTHSSIYF